MQRRLALLLAALVALGGAGSAAAAFPGKNGRLVYMRDFDLVTVSPFGKGSRTVVGSRADENNPQWSPDGERLVFQRAQLGVVSIWVANADGSRARRLAIGSDPAWSPDGERVAYVAQTGTNFDIWVIGADGKGKTRLTRGAAPEFYPAWSPDGKRIAFTTFTTRGTGLGGIFTVKAEPNVRPRRVTTGVDQRPAYSPDGTRIAFDGFRGRPGAAGTDVYVVGVDGKGLARLTTAAGEDVAPAWSPDGKRIAFASARGGAAIWIMEADGANQRRVTAPSAFATNPDWQPIPLPPPPPPPPPPAPPEPAPPPEPVPPVEPPAARGAR
ncbi:MAG: hypothetical protein R3C15_07125 [Thermoleophilia bacterium]